MVTNNIIERIKEIEEESDKILNRAYRRREKIIKTEEERLKRDKEAIIKDTEKKMIEVKKKIDRKISREIKKFERESEKEYVSFEHKIQDMKDTIFKYVQDALKDILKNRGA